MTLKMWKKRYSDWKIWCQYTNDKWLARVAALFGFKSYATLSFHVFRATLETDWRKKS